MRSSAISISPTVKERKLVTEDLPMHHVDATVRRDGDRWVLRMERLLRHPADRVWAALTHADEIRRWAPYAPDRDLDRVGDVPLPQAEGGRPADGPPEAGRVIVADPPHLLVLAWGEHELRWELTPTADGVLLVLSHVFDEPAEAPDYASGWHLCLAVLAARLDGQDPPPAAGEAAKDYGWERLREEYAQVLQPAT